MPRVVWVACAAGIALGAGAALLQGTLARRPAPLAPPASLGPARDAGASHQEVPAVAVRPEAAPPGPGEIAPSLRGTSPSGALRVDDAGHFAPDADAVLFIEYFLAASHEADPEQIRAWIEAAIRERLSPPADAEARAFVDRYLAYRREGPEQLPDVRVAESASLERRLQWLRELRRAHFGADLAERLFGEEEDAARIHLAMRELGERADLDEAHREEALRALEARYPERVRQARAAAALPVQHAREERALREAGASEAEIEALRVERFGPEAAARMAALDASRAAFDARLGAYREARAALGPDAAPEALGALREAHFPPEERERVRLLDRVEADTAP